jgi:N-acetylglutamate synthase-like GNAT family acetyltransferase
MYDVKIAAQQIEIDKILDLRYEVLRKPWDKSKDTATDDFEKSSVNAYIEENGIVISCGRLQDNGGGLGQIRFMAVNPNYQGKGLGKQILKALEEEGRKLQLNKIELQARENAVDFYKNAGYSIKEKSFKLWDIIQHYLMEKAL